MDIGPSLPIGKGRKVEVDVSTEKRPRGAPDTLVLCLFLRGSEAYDLREVLGDHSEAKADLKVQLTRK